MSVWDELTGQREAIAIFQSAAQAALASAQESPRRMARR